MKKVILAIVIILLIIIGNPIIVRAKIPLIVDPERQISQIKALSPQELELVLPELEGWSYIKGKLHRQFQFQSFVEAFGFMCSLALVSESIGHHPEWFNIYNQVTIDLTTHDAGGVSSLDIEWAQQANQLASR